MTPRGSIGIDIGGTKMAVAAVDLTHRILSRQTLPTEAGLGFGRAVDRLAGAIEQVCEQAGWEHAAIGGIGIGCAGPVDPLNGLINNPFTLEGWERCDIVRPLGRRFGVPTRLENDADAAVVGEYVAGAGRGADPVAMLTFGTGVGGGALFGGRIHRGNGGEHPELGHVVCDPDGPTCYCGARGCLESLASGTAIAAAGQSRGFTDARAVFSAADGGQAAAKAIVQRAADAAGTAAWILFHTLLPRRLILGGGVMDAGFHPFAEAIRVRLSSATQFTRSAVEVVPAELGNDAGIVGAAAMIR